MQGWKRWTWTAGKIVLTLAVLIFVGRQFYHDLSQPGIERVPWRPGWLLLSAGLYLVFLGALAGYWIGLLRFFGEKPALTTAVRAYFVGLLGKYVPGKAWALLLRGTLVQGQQVRLGVAILTGFYEVLTSMSAGAMLAGLGLLLIPDELGDWSWHPSLIALALLMLCIVPIAPGVANFLARKLAARFQQFGAYQLRPLRATTLIIGLLVTSLGWTLLGIAVWAIFRAVLGETFALTWETWARVTTAMALAYVAGFLAIFVPGGIGVREFLLLHLLAFAGPPREVAAGVLLLRLVWTAAEIVVAGLLFCLKPRAGS